MVRRRAAAEGVEGQGRHLRPPLDAAPLIPTLAVVGVGLIGGSFAAALRQTGQVGTVLGVGRDPRALEQARELQLIDRICTLPEAVAKADVIMLATPVGAMPALLEELAPHLSPDAVITDGGSTKQDVVRTARSALGAAAARFVPGHPIAGSEQSGPAAARPDLYLRRQVILTPLEENPPEVVARVRAAWQACGAYVEEMAADQHDRLMASVSHLPHLIAFAALAQIAGADDVDLRLRTAGTGFRDFSRIAASSPEMWRDILLANREAIRYELHEVQEVLERFDHLLEVGDGEAIEALIATAAQTRKRLPV